MNIICLGVSYNQIENNKTLSANLKYLYNGALNWEYSPVKKIIVYRLDKNVTALHQV